MGKEETFPTRKDVIFQNPFQGQPCHFSDKRCLKEVSWLPFMVAPSPCRPPFFFVLLHTFASSSPPLPQVDQFSVRCKGYFRMRKAFRVQAKNDNPDEIQKIITLQTRPISSDNFLRTFLISNFLSVL